jgi:hypothetical protein
MDVLLLVLALLIVLAIFGGFYLSNLIWILAVVLLAVLIWRVAVGASARRRL